MCMYVWLVSRRSRDMLHEVRLIECQVGDRQL